MNDHHSSDVDDTAGAATTDRNPIYRSEPAPVPVAAAAETVDELTDQMVGQWTVVTQGTRHLFDLDAGTYTRHAGLESLSGVMRYDTGAHHITHIDTWPKVGAEFRLRHANPDPKDHREVWRISSTVASITRTINDEAL